jgi:hypothetical protein
MDGQLQTVKRPVGRPRTGRLPAVFARVPPELYAAVTLESERRGVKPSAVIREALELVLAPLINRAA